MYTCVSHFLDAQVETCQKRKVTMLLLLLLMMMMVVVLWWCCCEGVVLIVMREDGDGEIYHDKVCWQQLFGKKPFTGPFGNWWCLLCWYLGGLLILFRLSLVSWWHFGGVSVVSWRCPVMFWVFCSCFGCFYGVMAVFRWCLGGIEGVVFSQLSWLTCQHKSGVNGNAKLWY